jgi:hypothetical protein
MHFNRNAHRFENQRHFRTHVLEAVDWWNREVAALDCRTMAGIAAFEFFAAAPRCFFGIDLDEAAIHADFPADAVEDEEFWFRTKVGGIAQTGGFEIGFSAFCNRTRVAIIALAIGWFDDVALHEQRGFFHERIDIRGVRIRHQQHIRRFDTFPAGDRRTVERMTGFKLVHVEMRNRHGDVLFFASCVSKAKINEFDFVVFHHLQDLCGRPCHANLLK